MDEQPTPAGAPDPPPEPPKAKAKKPAPAVERVSIEDMRKYGLTYRGGGTVQGSLGRMLPARDLGPEIAAYYVKDRAALLAVLGTGYYSVAAAPKGESDHAE